MNNQNYILSLIQKAVNNEAYFLKSNINIIREPRIFPFRSLNYAVYDSSLIDILLGEKISVKDIITERNLPKGLAEIKNLDIDINNIILMGDVNNIPLLDIQRNLYASKINSEADRKLLFIVKDKLEGERENNVKRLENDSKIYIADREHNTSLNLEIIREFLRSELENIRDSITDRTRFTGEFQRDNNLTIQRNLHLGDFSERNDIFLDKTFLTSILENDQNFILKRDETIRALKDYYYGNKMKRQSGFWGKFVPNNNPMKKLTTTNRATLYNVNLMTKKDGISKGTKFYKAKPVLVNREHFQAVYIPQKELEVLTKGYFARIDRDVQDLLIKIRILKNKSGELMEQTKPIFLVTDKGLAEREKISILEIQKNVAGENTKKKKDLVLDYSKAGEGDYIINLGIKKTIPGEKNPEKNTVIERAISAEKESEKSMAIEKVTFGDFDSRNLISKIELGKGDKLDREGYLNDVEDLKAYISMVKYGEINDNPITSEKEYKDKLGKIEEVLVEGNPSSLIYLMLDMYLGNLQKKIEGKIISETILSEKMNSFLSFLGEEIQGEEAEIRNGKIITSEMLANKPDKESAFLDKIQQGLKEELSYGQELNELFKGSAEKLHATILNREEILGKVNDLQGSQISKIEIATTEDKHYGFVPTILSARMGEFLSILENQQLIGGKEFGKGFIGNGIIGVTEDNKEAFLSKQLLSNLEIDTKQAFLNKEILGLSEDRQGKFMKQYLADKQARETKLMNEFLESIRNNEKDSAWLAKSITGQDATIRNGIYVPKTIDAVGVNSPENMWEEANIHDPNIDLDTTDPSEDKDIPKRWYDGAETPEEILYKMIIELKERNQRVEVPGEETAEMLKDILDEFLKNHVKSDDEGFEDMIKYIEALIESWEHKVCTEIEVEVPNTYESYKKDFQEEGSWKDPEWIGSEQIPEESGGGSWANVDLTKPSGATAEKLNATFAKNGGYLAGLGQACVDAEAKYGVNAYYIASHAVWESGWGKSKISRDKNNLFGYGAYDRSPYKSAWTFASKYDCIMTVMKNVARDYLNPQGRYYGGSPTLRGMNKRYATDKNWANGISKLMKQFAGGNPPNSSLAGFTVEPITNWYRYLEPTAETMVEQLKFPETDIPNWALHTPDGMITGQKSHVYVEKTIPQISEKPSRIEFRVRVDGGTRGASEEEWFRDDFNRSDFNPKSPVTYVNNGWRIEDAKAKADASSELTLNYNMDSYSILKLKRRVNINQKEAKLVSSTDVQYFNEIFDGYYNQAGTQAFFTSNNAYYNANGWRYFQGFGFKSALAGSLYDVANGQLVYNFDFKDGGKLKVGYINWCSETDSGFKVLIDGKQVYRDAGYGNGYPHGDWRNVTHATIDIPSGKHVVTIQAHNSNAGYVVLDYVEVYRTSNVYEPSTTGGGSYGSYFDIYINNNFVKRYSQNLEEAEELIARNIPAGNVTVKFKFYQMHPQALDFVTLDDILIIKDVPAQASSKSVLNFYIDNELKKTFSYTGVNWMHYGTAIESGRHNFKWEFIQNDDATTSPSYGLLDDVIILGTGVQLIPKWVCPPNSGGDLIDEILDIIKDERPKGEEPKNLNTKIWLYT